MLKIQLKSNILFNNQCGQASLEYLAVFTMLVGVFFLPYDGVRLYVWVIEVLEAMNLNYLNSLGLYAYPL